LKRLTAMVGAMSLRLLLASLLIGWSAEAAEPSRGPPVEEVNRAMAAAKAAIASSNEKAQQVQKEEQALDVERKKLRKREGEETAREKEEGDKLQSEKESLDKERRQISGLKKEAEEEMEKAKKQTDRAEWAQADALDKFKRYQKLHAESESMLQQSAANNDRAAKVDNEARQSFDQVRTEKAKEIQAQHDYRQKAVQAEAAEKAAWTQKAKAEALGRREAAELDALQAQQKSLADDKAKLEVELANVRSARQQVVEALAEAKNATKAATIEEADASTQKHKAKLTMEKAQHLMSVAKQMHDVAEEAMVAAKVLQSGSSLQQSDTPEVAPAPTNKEDSEEALSAAVAAAARAQKRLQHVKQELTAISSAKAKEAKDLQAKEQDLIDTMQSLERSKSMEEKTEREDAALKTQISSDESEVLTLKVTLIGVVVAFAAAAISYVKSQPPPKPKKLTEEKAIDQSPLSRRVDVEVQADAKGDLRGSPFHTPRTSPRDPFKPPPFGLGGAVNAPQFALPLQQQSGARQYFLSPTAKEETLREPLL